MKLKPNDAIRRGDGSSLPMQTRSVEIRNFDEESRSFDLVWTTGAKVRRYDWYRDEPYDEELVVTSQAVDLTRLNSGAPLLAMHNGWSLGSQLGVVERAWIEGGEGLARVRFPKSEDDPDADKIFRKIKDKIIRNVSVGYRIRKVERERGGDDIVVWRVVDWEPFEISIVSVPADTGAGIRSDTPETYPVIFINRAAPDLTKEPSKMDGQNPAQTDADKTRATTGQHSHGVADNPNGAHQHTIFSQTESRAAPPAAPAATQERSWSVTDISRLTARAEAFGLDASAAVDVMASARSLDEATDALQERAAAKGTPRQTAQSRVITDEGDTKRRAIENAVLHRASPSTVQLTEPARDYRGMSLLEMGRTYVEDVHNIRLRGLSKMELATVLLGLDTRAGMMSTSDFPKLLGNVASARLRDTYGETVQTWKPFCRQSNAPDFKERSIVMMAGMPEFQRVREGGEYTYAKLSESSEKYALATYGRMIAITRQTLINDDLGAFDRLPTLFGRGAANLESDLVWSILLDNPKMGDGKTLFHADHGNEQAADDITEAAIEKMDISMGAQTGADGKPLNIRPKFIAVSRKHKVQAQKLLAAVTAAKTGDVNVYQNAFNLIVEDRLYKTAGACPWFTIADPATWDTIEYGYLEGEQGLYTEERVGFDVDGIEIKARLDFAAKAIDFRGFQKNPGK